MRELIHSLRTGDIELIDVPCPAVKSGHLLIRSASSLISAGTERMLVQFGKAGLVQKARQQPERVREAIDKVRTDGLLTTVQAINGKLDKPLALGYCNVGTVLEVGAGVEGFQVGDRVLSNGNHAEIVHVPQNLCAKIPDSVADEEAALAVVGAVGLQGIRLAAPSLGETFAVFGLGLIGLLTVQLLRAHGCHVIGFDFDASRLKLAREFGAETFDLASDEDPVLAATAFTHGRGADGVLITASSNSDEPMHLAAQMSRKRGRVVLVGAVGLNLERADFYEKELSFQVSCSYGPGRYDPSYEDRGIDYPVGFVRWTAQRNFEAVLAMMAEGKLAAAALISHTFDFDEAPEAYNTLVGDQPSLGVVLSYPKRELKAAEELRSPSVSLRAIRREAGPSSAPVVSFIGAGNYAAQVLIPAFKQAGARFQHVVSQNGLSAVSAARKYGFAEATTDVNSVFSDSSVSAVVIATRHDTHARFVCESLRAGKHVFVEKPLALNRAELAEIEKCVRETQAEGARQVLSVGFNRRFAPQVTKIAELLADRIEPMAMVMTVNAGALPSDHWLNDRNVGGGRIVGEGCHFIELLRFLARSPVSAIQATATAGGQSGASLSENVTCILQFADGSTGTIHYLANGHRGFSKERLDIFTSGRILQLDNFRKLRGYGWPNFRRLNCWKQDKGHSAGARAFLNAVSGLTDAPFGLGELLEVTQASFDVLHAVESGERVEYCHRQGERKVA